MTTTPETYPRVRLDIYDDAIRTTIFGDRGLQEFIVKPEAVAQAFQVLEFSTGPLPPNCLYACRNFQHGMVYAIYIAAHRRTLTTNGGLTVDMPLPPMVLIGRGHRYTLVAVKEAQFPNSLEIPVFYPPLSNIMDRAGMCLGNNDPIKCDANSIQRVLDTFCSSLFTAHMIGGRCASKPANIYDLWQQIDGMETFPLDELVPIGGLTLARLLEAS